MISEVIDEPSVAGGLLVPYEDVACKDFSVFEATGGLEKIIAGVVYPGTRLE